MEFKEWVELWYNAVRHPRSTFKKQKNKANYEDGAVNIISESVISQVLAVVSTWALVLIITNFVGISIEELISQAAQRGNLFLGGVDLELVPINIVINFVVALIIGIVSWFVFGWIAYKISLWFQGKGNLKTQLYLVSLYSPGFAVLWWFPILLMNAGLFLGLGGRNILAMVGGMGVAIILLILVLIYQIYCFVYALVETHNYSAGTGLGVCLIGSLIIGAIVFGLMMVGFLIGFGLLNPGITPFG